MNPRSYSTATWSVLRREARNGEVRYVYVGRLTGTWTQVVEEYRGTYAHDDADGTEVLFCVLGSDLVRVVKIQRPRPPVLMVPVQVV